mmetsp:Transcript_50807/g.61157  ORF Transcript_50807/g.61157 Transcript_50807/m.61157 type:complete len:134 (-) Transcript_50807:315-716(-)
MYLMPRGKLLFTVILFAVVHAFFVNTIKTNLCQDDITLHVQHQHQHDKHAQGDNLLPAALVPKNHIPMMLLEKNIPLSNSPGPTAAEESTLQSKLRKTKIFGHCRRRTCKHLRQFRETPYPRSPPRPCSSTAG